MNSILECNELFKLNIAVENIPKLTLIFTDSDKQQYNSKCQKYFIVCGIISFIIYRAYKTFEIFVENILKIKLGLAEPAGIDYLQLRL